MAAEVLPSSEVAGWIRRAPALPRADKSAWSGFGPAEPGPKDKPQGWGEHQFVGNEFGRAQRGPKGEPQGWGEQTHREITPPCDKGVGGDVFPADSRDALLLNAIQRGLPLVSRPYAELGRLTGLSEAEVIARLEHWTATGLIKRLGVVVRHRPLGYRANAMVVFDIPDERVADIGRRMSAFAFVTLCYRRPRRGEDWPYNLFCMIHGKDRAKVEAQVELLALATGLADAPRAVLFSRRCFKQRGARYTRAGSGSA